MENIIGNQIKGYQILERIGAGGFGAVYRAEQSTVGREVAIKKILPGYANNPDFIRRFETEAQVVARLEHLHITPLYDFWRDPQGAYLVMRLMKGGSLKNALQKTTFSLEETAQVIDQIASALVVAHRNNVIHRDIKPTNILLDEDKNAYLSDFGIALDLEVDPASLGSENGFTGSPDYISPEQARMEAITPQTDIYSLGVVIYELLTGEHPFPDVSAIEKMFKHINEPIPTITTLDIEIARDVNEIIQKATAKNPKNRFAHVMTLATAFRDAAGLSPSQAGKSLVALLTPREQEVLKGILEGKSNREIADELTVEISTVKWYVNQVYRKLNVRSRVQAIVRARELNLIVDSNEPVEVSSTASELPEPENPYKGLQAFQAADEHQFFGREELIQKLISRLLEKGRYSRFVAVIGPSGSGKSSLVKAGLVPALWRGELPGSANWFIVEMVPGPRPLDELEVALTRIAANQGGNIGEHLRRDVNGLSRATGLILPDDGSELLVLIDHFEEIFTLVRDEEKRKYFLDLLYSTITDQQSRVRLVITLRADFYDRPLQYSQFGDMIQNRLETILPLSAEQLERVITLPAKQMGVSFEEGLVATIIEDVNYQPGALPLLQYALTELFESRKERKLTQDAYLQIGGAVGALAKRAEELYSEMDTEGKEQVRQMFLRLVAAGEGAEDIRRRVPRSELLEISKSRDLMEESIDTFARYRLLSLDHDPSSREPTVELAHEAILREWKRLEKWLEEAREDLHLQQKFSQAAQEWHEADKDSSFLLRGSRLHQFYDWMEETNLAFTHAETEFLHTSLNYERERNRIEAEQAKHQQNLRRAFVGTLIVGLVISIFLAFFAASARDDAIRSAAEFRSIALASAAKEELDEGFPDTALTLALEANNMEDPPPRSQQMLFTAATSAWMRQRFEHDAAVRGVTYSPDGKFLLTTGDNQTATLWDLETRRIVNALVYHDVLWKSAFQPNGDLIAITAWDGNVILWNPISGDVSYLKVSDAGLTDIVFTEDGSRMLVGGEDRRITLWDVGTRSLVQTYDEHTSIVFRLDFNSDDTQFVSGSNDNTARVWDVATGEVLAILEMPEDDNYLSDERGVSGVQFLPDGQHVVTGDLGGYLYLWDIISGEVIRKYTDVRGPIASVELSNDGSMVLMGTTSGEAYMNLYHVENGEVLRTYFGHRIGIYGTAFSPEGKTIASASTDGTAAIWDLQIPGVVYKVDLPVSGGGSEIAMHPDGESFFESGFDGIIRQRDVYTGQTIRTFEDNSGRWTLTLAVSPDGNYLLSGDYVTSEDNEEQNAYLWDISTGKLVHTFDQSYGPIFSVAFSPDGKKVAVGETAGKRVLVYDLLSGRLVNILEGHTSWIQYLVFSPDGLRLYTAGRDLTIREWDVATGENLRVFEGHTSRVRAIDISPDGKKLISGSDDFTLKLWDLESGLPIRTFIGHDSFVYRVHYSPDGNYILSTGFNLNVILWDAETGRPIWKMHGHSPNTIDIVVGDFTPDGKMIITISEDSEVIAWDIAQLPDDLVSWVMANRYIPDLTCEQKELYRVEPLCEAESN